MGCVIMRSKPGVRFVRLITIYCVDEVVVVCLMLLAYKHQIDNNVVLVVNVCLRSVLLIEREEGWRGLTLSGRPDDVDEHARFNGGGGLKKC